MNKKILIPAALAAAAITLVTTACGTPTEPNSAPSSVSASGSTNDRELFREQSRAAERRLEHNGELGIPGPVISQLAEVAVQDGTPLAFSWGDGCTWVRTPDGSLWSLHSGGGPLTRDDRQRDWFKAHPGALVAKECYQLGSMPTQPDPKVSTPFRWRDGATTKVSIDGRAYALPAQISERGAVLVAEASAGPTTPTK
ncbi:Uncharacterised protein [Mycobacteroides abscessus subsp. massiliense]|uniref:hypothetical protein n=1 Tax=Mycobacteroides abscessus TaxID=36809 RepID=UPI0009A577C7|nr:hypothetical protein [Mycobacteroides abscessus]SKE70749.1 Uncharacterised protein [Mycobacteroides abscessus subsp. massiliense]SKH80528.1 Uncharacterised protein [Mycobacteroides abscessus subsp. massiliense]SKI34232.1 Uncharacterised protein [Mycobacteroides abscessus subsp. massiliense]SKJ36966.1 Uncharacterised protein [Mycobacteroides abscessus subsp. massiliense]SKK23222.1 Uncharacterised protein [Mycobacteroides abscessus subsp. massiliense]